MALRDGDITRVSVYIHLCRLPYSIVGIVGVVGIVSFVDFVGVVSVADKVPGKGSDLDVPSMLTMLTMVTTDDG